MNNLSNWTNGIEGDRNQGYVKDTNRDVPLGNPTYECRMKELQTLGCYSEVTNLGEAASLYMQAGENRSATKSTQSNVSLGKETPMCEQVNANSDIPLERHDSCVNTLANSALSGIEDPPQNVEPNEGDVGTHGGANERGSDPGSGQGSGERTEYQNGLMKGHTGKHTNDRGVDSGEAAPPVKGQESVEMNKNNLDLGQNEELGSQTSSHLPIEEKQANGRAKWSLQEEQNKTTEEVTQHTQRENNDLERSHSSDVNDYTLFGQQERDAVEVECMKNGHVKGQTSLREDQRGDYCDADKANLPPIQEPNALISSGNEYEHAQVNTFSSDSKETDGEGEEVRPTSKDNSNDGLANKLTSASPEEEKKKKENLNIEEEQNEKCKNQDEVLQKGNEPTVSAPSDEAINSTSSGNAVSRSRDSVGGSESAANQIEIDGYTWINREITKNEYKKKKDITEVGDDSHLSNAKKKSTFSSPVNNTITCDHQLGTNCDDVELGGSKMSTPPCGTLGFHVAQADVEGSYKLNINACASVPSSELIAARGTEGVPREEVTTGSETPNDALQPCDIAHPGGIAIPNGTTVCANALPNACTTFNAPENRSEKMQDLAGRANPDTMPTSLDAKMDSIPRETHEECEISPPNEVAHAHAPLTKLPCAPPDVRDAELELQREEKDGKDGEDETNIGRSTNAEKLSSHTIESNLESENKAKCKIAIERQIAVEHEIAVEREIDVEHEITIEGEKKTENIRSENYPNWGKNQGSEKIASSQRNSKGQKGTPRAETAQTAQVPLHTPMEQTAPNSAASSPPVRSSISFNEVPLRNLNQGLNHKQIRRQNSKQFPSQHTKPYPSDNQPLAMDQGTKNFSTNHRNCVQPVGVNNLQKNPHMENLKNGATIDDHMDMCTLPLETQGEELREQLSYGTNGITNGDLARANHLNSANNGTGRRSGSGVNGVNSVSDQGVANFINAEQLENYLNEKMKMGNPVHREVPVDTIPKQIMKKKISQDTTFQDNDNDHIEYKNNEMLMRKVSQDTIVNDMMEDNNMSLERNKEMIFKKITQEVASSTIHKPNFGHVNNDHLVKKRSLDTTMSCMKIENMGSMGKDIILHKLSEHGAVGELLGEMNGISEMNGMNGVGVGGGMDNMARMNGRSGVHHVDDSNEENTRHDLYRHHHVLYNQSPQSEINDRNFKEEMNLQSMMGFHDHQSVISCAHDDSPGNHCEVSDAYNRVLDNHTIQSNTKEADLCSNVDFTDDKYNQWFDTIYTVCVKLDDLCCKLNSDYPHSMHIWESNGNPSVYDLKSAFQNRNKLKIFSHSNQVEKVAGGVDATVPTTIYNDLNSSDNSVNSNYMYAVTHVSNNNQGAMKKQDQFVQDNFENGLPEHVKNNCKQVGRMYGMSNMNNNINSNNQYGKDLAHVYSACDDHLKRIQTKSEHGKAGRKRQHEYALHREMYNHGNSRALQDGSTLLYDREKNGMKTDIAILPGALSKDALELLQAYGKADSRVNDKFKVELYNAPPQYGGHGDGMDGANHNNGCHRGAAPFSSGIPTVISNNSIDMALQNGDSLSIAKKLSANGLMQYVKNENNDGFKNANDASANTTKRRKGGKRNTINNNKSVEKKNIKKYGTVSRTNTKIIKNESEFEYLLELSDKEGPNLENPDDLKCDVAGVYWDKRSWIASWYDNGKRYYKSFSAKTHGFYKSKFWAIKVRLSKVKGQTIFGKNCRKNKDDDGCNTVHNDLTFNSSIVSENNNVLLGNI
ncbi:hypothetical protein C922_02427 [Plasmodium inui San Antonio 1]|uniref:Uncharacterized protein n=1 Tax=Plasmodium inui San Antonio 1 TaxID=1237626 RepID=W7A229_9APIC|nr:hypothetical protein C922_02427 [Plasmodium inui San Antonio 1]EUD67277.1 hypothetical protein C922_02427 [Plasmodium inui San Antonio 1]